MTQSTKNNRLFWYGEETFLLHDSLKKLKKGRNVVVLEGKEITKKDILSAVSARSFFSEEILFLIKDALLCKALNDAVDIVDTIVHYVDDAHSVLFLQEGKPDKRRKLFKILEENMLSQEFLPLEGRELAYWIRETSEQKGVTLTLGAVSLLSSYFGNNLWILERELEKLALSLSSEQNTITEDLIISMTTRTLQANVFDLVDALGERKKDKTIKLLHSLADDKYDLIPLYGMVARQIRLLIHKKTGGTEWAKNCNLHPFVAKKVDQQSRNFSLDELYSLHEKFYQLDKSLKTSSASPFLLADVCFSQL